MLLRLIVSIFDSFFRSFCKKGWAASITDYACCDRKPVHPGYFGSAVFPEKIEEELEKTAQAELHLVTGLFFTIFSKRSAGEQGKAQPQLPVGETGVGNFRDDGCTPVVKVDDGCQTGGEVENIKGLFLREFGIQVVAASVRSAVPAQAQLSDPL